MRNENTKSVIVDFNSNKDVNINKLFRHIKNILEYFNNEILIVVAAYGDGIDFLNVRSEHIAEINSLMVNKVEFKACNNSMVSKGVTKADLINDVEVVPSGLGYIIEMQLNDFAYIKEG